MQSYSRPVPMFGRLFGALVLAVAVVVASSQVLASHSGHGGHSRHGGHHYATYGNHQQQHYSGDHQQQYYDNQQHHYDGHVAGHSGGHVGGHAGGHIGAHLDHHAGASSAHGHGHGLEHGHHSAGAAQPGGSTIINHIHIGEPAGAKKAADKHHFAGASYDHHQQQHQHQFGHGPLATGLGVSYDHHSGHQHQQQYGHGPLATGYHSGAYSQQQHGSYGAHGAKKQNALVNLAKRHLASRLAAAYGGASGHHHQSGGHANLSSGHQMSFNHLASGGSRTGSTGSNLVKAALKQVAKKAAARRE